MTKEQAKIILAYAENDMKIKPTSEKIYMCEANVHYHLNKIKKQMGWNPRKFYDLCYLVGIAAQRMGGNTVVTQTVTQDVTQNAVNAEVKE